MIVDPEPQYAQFFFDANGSGKYIGGLISDKFSQVKAMLNVDGSKAIVFGLDKSGKPSTGVLNYPTSGSPSVS